MAALSLFMLCVFPREDGACPFCLIDESCPDSRNLCLRGAVCSVFENTAARCFFHKNPPFPYQFIPTRQGYFRFSPLSDLGRIFGFVYFFQKEKFILFFLAEKKQI